MGAGVALTYSFLGNSASFIVPYGSGQFGQGEFHAYYVLSSTEKAGVNSALAAWGHLANITFIPTFDNASIVGDLRFGITSVGTANQNGHAYLPDGSPEGGDVWLSSQHWHNASNTRVAPGTYDYLTLIHEIGHALGLKHPFEDSPILPPAYDNYSYTIMSYTAKAGLHNNYASFYPTT